MGHYISVVVIVLYSIGVRNLTPIFIVLVGFSLSWTTMNSLSRIDLGVFILASVGRSHSSFIVVSSKRASKSTVLMSGRLWLEMKTLFAFLSCWRIVVVNYFISVSCIEWTPDRSTCSVSGSS